MIVGNLARVNLWLIGHELCV